MDRLTEIFDKQRELATKFHQIEKANRVWDWDHALEVPIDGVFGQERLRSLAWRVVEELAEAIDSEATGSPDELREELVDVGHFLVELMLTAGITPELLDTAKNPEPEEDILGRMFTTMGLTPVFPTVRAATPNFIRSLGMALHALKAKAWKKNPAPTSAIVFRVRMVSVFYMYVGLLQAAKMTDIDFYHGYLNKNQKNHQRIAGGS